MSTPKKPQLDDGGVTTEVERKTKQKLQRPKLFKVLLLNDDYTTMEFVLFALTRDPVAVKILKASGADLKKLQKELETFFAENMPELPEGVEREPQQTAAFWRALQRAAMHVQSSGKEFIDGGNLLVAFYREPQSHSVYLLQKQGVTRLDVMNFIAHGIRKSQAAAEDADDDEDEEL